MHAKAEASNRMAKDKQSKSWSKSVPSFPGKGKSKESNVKSRGKSKRTKSANQGAKGLHKGKTSKAGLSVLENSKPEASSDIQESAQTCATGTSPGTMVGMVTNGTMAGVSMSEMRTGVLLDGTKVGNKRMTLPQAHFSLEGLDVSAPSSPKRFEWVKMNLDTGAAVNTFPLNFGPEGAGDGRFFRTASGEWIPDGGARQSEGYDKNGLLRSLNGRLAGVHKVLCCAAEIACKGRQDFYLGHDGGYMIPMHSKIGQGMRIHFEKLVNWYGKKQLIPVFLGNNIFNFYLIEK